MVTSRATFDPRGVASFSAARSLELLAPCAKLLCVLADDAAHAVVESAGLCVDLQRQADRGGVGGGEVIDEVPQDVFELRIARPESRLSWPQNDRTAVAWSLCSVLPVVRLAEPDESEPATAPIRPPSLEGSARSASACGLASSVRTTRPPGHTGTCRRTSPTHRPPSWPSAYHERLRIQVKCWSTIADCPDQDIVVDEGRPPPWINQPLGHPW